ncbi:MAG: nuclear transport factor 2 family protein [Acidobacteria bacterium]|nr:nuclear transport factor 2 family protein [Acidobacteriota bacterium]MCA1638534.1 nuclear transport factor 2 family protein [Acidobacteriota bacterium]
MLKILTGFCFVILGLGVWTMIGRTQLSEVEENSETPSAQVSPQKFADEMEIRRVVDEIDNAVDAKDWVKARTFFAAKVAVDFTSLADGKPAQITADELVGGWRTNLYSEKKSFHQRGNHRIEINGKKAEVFSKAYAFNLLETGAVKGLWEVWGNYTHTLERTKDGWKVSGMTLDVIYQRGDDKVRTFVPEK